MMFASVYSWFSRPVPVPSPRPANASPLAGRHERPTSEQAEPVGPPPTGEHAEAEAAAIRAAARPTPAPAPRLPRAACAADQRLIGDVIEDRHRIELVNDRLRARNAALEAENEALREKAGT